MVITREFAAAFAAQWIAAWNARDLLGVLSHYTNDFEMGSPLILEVAGEPSGCLRGKETVRTCWQAALKKHPGLHFELLDVFVGADSVELHYRRIIGQPAAEVFFFNEQGLVYQAAAHYQEN